MGLFSFLSGKKEDAVETPSSSPAPAGAMPAVPPSGTATATASATIEPPSLPEPSSFVPPESWNLDALTAPPPASAADAPNVGAPDAAKIAELQAPIVEALKTVYDPEIPVDIYELGLIYDIIVDAERKVLVKMTLTSPACPSATNAMLPYSATSSASPGVSTAPTKVGLAGLGKPTTFSPAAPSGMYANGPERTMRFAPRTAEN